MNLAEIKKLIPKCCTVAKIDINKCYKNEKRSLEEFLPSVKSIIVLGHHIRDSREWIWSRMKSERGNCTSIADLHTKDIIKEIKNFIELEGYNSKIIPYPGVSGIRFKKLAMKTRIGEIGDNFLFLHNEWGPWVHLRVLLTDTKINSSQETFIDEVCIHCGKCIKACPVNAIIQNSFNSQRCKERQEQLNVAHSCEICARICPIGETPEKIKLVKVDE
ncbi:4Fe-4S protein [Halobacteroides halobius DSM 5150]|uniref:4Fe-4S protein n=1 Tax=Halobacteroides halobius (strain ATCC 35273 / DSM 5150 / MD-1) TaxID=748449 RepID=L0KAM2_HALHC|nr:4Fe-4S binding protein [Halobacteroides halobius]AGB41414.1 4Fe-4S protein [Halobacteroides halobius DSM 5150]